MAPGRRYPLPPHPHSSSSSPRAPKPRPRLQLTFRLSRGLPKPGRHVEAAPPPLPFRGPSASRGSLNPATAGPAVLAVNPFSNRGRGGSSPAGDTHRAPPSPRPAGPFSDQGLARRPCPEPSSRETRWGWATPQAGGGGSLSRGCRAGGRAEQAQGRRPGRRAARRSVGAGPGTAAAAGGRGCYLHVCVRVWGWGEAVCVSGRPG